MKNNFALIGIIVVSIISLFSASALAFLVSDWWGTVHINTVLAQDGTVVDVYHVETGNLVDTTTCSGGYYLLHVVNVSEGDHIVFKVNGMLVNEGPQNITALDDNNLDLTVTDADGDGYSVKDDCNDNDAAIHPGATEICNGIDDNCVGGIDEGSYYCDMDNDGYISTDTSGCSVGNSCRLTPAGDDCDDNDDDINPGANEICGNGKDDNCDGISKSCGGGGGSTAYCGDGAVQTSRGEQCEKDSDCQATYVCNASCNCVPCTESWSCGEWGSCSSEGVQTRTCTDANACGTTNDKPAESQTCTSTSGGGSTAQPLGGALCGNDVCDDGESCDTCPEDCGVCGAGTGAAVGTQSGTGLIGMLFGASGLPFLGLIILLLIALLVLLMTRKKKKK
jgi:hypothetical protein